MTLFLYVVSNFSVSCSWYCGRNIPVPGHHWKTYCSEPENHKKRIENPVFPFGSSGPKQKPGPKFDPYDSIDPVTRFSSEIQLKPFHRYLSISFITPFIMIPRYQGYTKAWPLPSSLIFLKEQSPGTCDRLRPLVPA